MFGGATSGGGGGEGEGEVGGVGGCTCAVGFGELMLLMM